MGINKFFRLASAGLGLAVALCLAFPVGASALDFSGYFSFSYNPSFSQTTVYPGGSLSLTLTGIATCEADLPFTVSGAVVSGRVLAIGANSDTFVLNPGYAVSIGAFQTKKGQSVQSTQTLALSFPGSMAPGQYNIVGQVIEAKVQVVLWFNVNSYVPSSTSLGTVTLLAPPAPVPPPVPTPTPSPAPTPTASTVPPPVTTTMTVTSPPVTTADIVITTTGPTGTAPAEPIITSPPVTPTATGSPSPTTAGPLPIITTGPTPTSDQTPVPATSTPVKSAQPTTIISVTPPASTSASILPMATVYEDPSSGNAGLPEDSGFVPWIIFPSSVGVFTFLLVILAVARSPRRPEKKDDYILEFPEL